MIPTYNEAENIVPLIGDILMLGEEFEALVVDDNSPDGTWRLVKEMAQKNPRVHLLHRVQNKGRGLAGIAGFREAVALGADWVIEMDADFSHHPRFIPALVEASRNADLVIGSRLVAGGGEVGRSPARKLITGFASAFIRITLGLPIKDPTSGFRVFSRALLESLPWDAMRATGPEVVQEVLVAAHARGFKMVEVPILFEERRAGVSTFNAKIMIRSFLAIWRLRLFSGALKPKRNHE